ncbi:MAG: asparaginase [Planctomycetota bacterium]
MPPPSTPRTTDVRLVEVTRGDLVESEHYGAIAVARSDGSLWTAGEVDRPVWTRSAIKPLQALPLLRDGIADRLGLSDEEIALTCASHDGTDLHVATARALLARGGLVEDALGCGPHAPFDRAAGLDLARSGGKPQRVHNNCSGKHAGFLLLAQSLGQDLRTYLDPHGPSQSQVRAVVAEFADLAPDAIPLAIDGCGAPTMAMPLTALARAFLRFVNPTGGESVSQRACSRILHAVAQAPEHLGGRGRLGTLCAQTAPGRVIAKNGAEGVYVVGGRGRRGAFGVALKVRDGQERAVAPVVVELLRRLGLWEGDAAPPAFAEHARPRILNTNKLPVGEVRLTVELPSWS